MVLSDSVKAIFNCLHEGINIIDVEETIVFANEAYRQFLQKDGGIEPDCIEGKRLRDLRPGAADAAFVEHDVARLHRGGEQ